MHSLDEHIIYVINHISFNHSPVSYANSINGEIFQTTLAVGVSGCGAIDYLNIAALCLNKQTITYLQRTKFKKPFYIHIRALYTFL